MDGGMTIKWMVPLFMLSATVLDAIHRLYRRHDHNVPEGLPLRDLGWVSWGWILPNRHPAFTEPGADPDDKRYFLLRLPIYQWRTYDLGTKSGLLPMLLLWIHGRGWRAW